jgi:hypothetical protein
LEAFKVYEALRNSLGNFGILQILAVVTLVVILQ